MELFIITFIGTLLGVTLFKIPKPPDTENSKWEHQKALWAYEDSTEYLKAKQEFEDAMVFDAFQIEWSRHLRDIISADYDATWKFIIHNPDVFVPLEQLVRSKIAYKKYVEECKKLHMDHCMLSLEHFMIKEAYPQFCSAIGARFWFGLRSISTYTIHWEPTARYKDNMIEVLKQEYNNRYETN